MGNFEVVEEVRKLIEASSFEIVLSGVNLHAGRRAEETKTLANLSNDYRELSEAVLVLARQAAIKKV